MSGKHVQRSRGRGEVGSSRSMWFYSSEYGIFYLKYGIEEFSSRLIFWKVLDNLRDCTISGFYQVIHVDVLV